MRIIWIFVVLGGFAGLSLHLYHIIAGYLQFKSTESTYEKRTGFKFPDVTVCDLHGISSSNFRNTINENPKFKNVYSEILKTLQGPDHNTENRNQSERSGGFRSREDLFWGLENEAHQAGHKLQDMILSCKFERHECGDEDFVLFPISRTF